MNGRARPRLRAWSSTACLLLASVAALAADVTEPPPQYRIQDAGEIFEHLIEPYPYVTTSWVDITADHDSPHWTFDLEVNEAGEVSTARLTGGSPIHREEAQRAAESVRFKPFEREGKPVPVRLEFGVGSRPTDYAGPADRTFPADPDPSKTVIALARSGCFGSCPSYRVELSGNGEVRYLGKGDVLVTGAHQWRIDPARIAALLDLFRRANYFTLDGRYEAPVTDLPTYISRLSIGDRHKFVLDYGGDFGGAVASTRMSGEFPDMPAIVSEIENAIDEVSGAVAYVSGNEATIPMLKAERWNFRSRSAGQALAKALSDCNTRLAREFIHAGAPVDVRVDGFMAQPAIAQVPYCADIDLARLLVAKGALKRREDAKSFLWGSVESGDPEMVALALTRYRGVNGKDEDGASLLAHAAESFADEGAPNAARFDSVKVIELLIKAGARPNSRDDEGRTPLFEANDESVARALIRGGANPGARDDLGRTALFDEYFTDSITAPLVEAGLDVNARDHDGRTALFFQRSPDSVKALIAAGADIEAVDSEGRTAVEAMNTESFTLTLLSAGARLPADPARLDAMIAKAIKEKWNEVMPLLQPAAGKN